MTKVFRNVGIGVVVGLLVGCTSMPPMLGGNGGKSPNPRTPTESKSCAEIYQGQNGANDQFWTRAVPAIVGAILGGAAGNAAGKDTESTVIGAILGGIVGLTLGDLVAKRKEGYANREAAILTECEIVKRQIDALMVENRQLEQDISDYKQQIATLKGNKASLQAQKAKLEKRYKEANKRLKKANTDLADARDQYNHYKKASTKDDAEMKKWETQVAQLEDEKRTLDSHVNTLFSMTQAL